MNRLRCGITYLNILALAGISGAQAALPVVEGPKSSADKTFYGQISGYINDGVVLGGLILAAVALLTVANAIIATFAEVRDGEARGLNLACWWSWGLFWSLRLSGW